MSTKTEKQDEDNPNIGHIQQPPRPSLNRTMSFSDSFFSQRIVTMDFYMSPPSEFDPAPPDHRFSEDHPRVPVLRIFGSTPKGQNCTTHVHGVFPYITILYDTDIENFEGNIVDGIENALNNFLKTATRPDQTRPDLRSVFRRHIFKAVKICGRTYYGYRHTQEAFLRIYLYSPFVIKKVAELLLTGSIIDRKFQPYDAHIPYHLQFMIDYNLYGMNLVHFGAAKFRRKIGQDHHNVSPVSRIRKTSTSSSGVTAVWNLSQLPDSLFTKSLEKVSVSELEIDVCAIDINVVPTRSNARSSNPGIDSIWQDEIERRRLLEQSQVSIPESQSRNFLCGDLFSTEALYKEILLNKLANLPYIQENIPPSLNTFRDTEEVNDGVLVSEVVNHFSNNVFNEDHKSTAKPSPLNQTQHSDEDDELYELFKEFMNEKADAVSDYRAVATSKPPPLLTDIDDEISVDQQDDDEVDDDEERSELEGPDDWNQSFLSNSILKSIFSEKRCENDPSDVDNKINPISSDAINDDRRHTAKDQFNNLNNDVIFQGDGFQDISDDSELGTKSSKQSSRQSARKRRTPRKYKDNMVDMSKKGKHIKKNVNRECFPSAKLSINDDDQIFTSGNIGNTVIKKDTRILASDVPSTTAMAAKLKKPNTVERPGPKCKKKYLLGPIFAKAFAENPNQKKVIKLHIESEEYKEIIDNNPIVRVQRFEYPITIQSGPSSSRDKHSMKTRSSKLKNPITKSNADKNHKPPCVPLQLDTVQSSSSQPTKSQNEKFKTKRNIKRSKKDKLVATSNSDHSLDSDNVTSFIDQSKNNIIGEPSLPSTTIVDPLSAVQEEFTPASSVSQIIHTKKSPLLIELSQITKVSSTIDDDSLSGLVSPPRTVEIQTERPLCHALDFKSSEGLVRTPILQKQRTITDDEFTASAQEKNADNMKQFTVDDVVSPGTVDEGSKVIPIHCTPTKKKLSPSNTLDLVSSTRRGIEERANSPDANLTAYKTLFKKILRKNQKSSSMLSISPPASKFSPLLNPVVTPPRGKISCFQIKRSASRSKTRKKRLEARAKKLQANNKPDLFRNEFEPLKIAPSFKVILKQIKKKQREERKGCTGEVKCLNKEASPDGHSSQEGTPQKIIRKCNNLDSSSDEDSDDSDHTDTSAVIKSVTSLKQTLTPITVAQMSHNSSKTPKSILRTSCKSAREMQVSGKRKIRWDNNSPSVKKFIKLDPVTQINSGDNPPLDEQALINNSEIDGPSPKNKFGFELDMSNLQDAKALHQIQHINVMSVELHCHSRTDLVPDPTYDKILGIFVYVYSDHPDTFHQRFVKSFLVINTQHKVPSADPKCEYFLTEIDLLHGFLTFYHKNDPDILVGYETELCSWGYIISRGAALGLDLLSHLSRLQPVIRKPGTSHGYERKQEGWDGQIPGRIVLNLWRLLRHEITVMSYTYENTAYHVLHRRVCHFNNNTLMNFWDRPNERWRVLEYYDQRAKGNIEIMNSLDMVNRTSELARLFGILFYEVFSRGSQFRVESMMLRVTKCQNLIPVSPSVGQRAKMRAPEFLPLILEPQSNYYTDPVAVLDFQSLYPSMMIAYNYDYATVIGRVEHLGREDPFELGCIQNQVSTYVLKKYFDAIHISPAGVVFVNSTVRKGVLPQLLEQILDTRQMVKRSMKKWKTEGATLQKILDSRQLGLKMIANVTYGYTSANFSGRMPCVDIADSVVSKGRETLQRAIDFVKSKYDKWGGEVIYGDTDSMFVLFRGRTRSEAFRLGQEIADQVTKLNPKPVKLKFEKIYQPCILQSKKRYVGYSYETEDQVEPLYDAKGIETVRRDGCPAVKKILEKSLHILFTTNDSEKVKTFLQLQFKKLFTGRVSMKDYMFARQYRGREGYKPGACVPSLEIAKKLAQLDPRSEPLSKQRVPYVIVYDKPTLPLIKLVRTPIEFANDSTLRLNAHYYIEKAIIPALNRCLGLAKMNVTKWYKSLPRKYLRNILDDENQSGPFTLDEFMQHANCLRCDRKTEKGICANCDSDIQKSTSFFLQVSSNLSTKMDTACRICVMCSGDDDKCDNTDCPVFHKLLRYERDEQYNKHILFKLKRLEI